MKDHVFYITGTSSGIGHALASLALKKGAQVIGISRSNKLEHENYTHIQADLSRVDLIEKIDFKEHENAQSIILINNAGTLGEIQYVGNLNQKNISQAINLNFTAPFVLLNKFIKQYKDSDQKKFVLNMSSGAGKNPYDGWSAYCSTKAALDMLTRVTEKEIKNSNIKNFKLYACSPGVVETNMQSQIRSTSKQAFSLKEKFIELHKNGINKAPEKSAQELLSLVTNAEKHKELFTDFWQG